MNKLILSAIVALPILFNGCSDGEATEVTEKTAQKTPEVKESKIKRGYPVSPFWGNKFHLPIFRSFPLLGKQVSPPYFPQFPPFGETVHPKWGKLYTPNGGNCTPQMGETITKTTQETSTKTTLSPKSSLQEERVKESLDP